MQNGRGCRSMLHPPSVRYTSFDIASPLFLTQLTRDLFYNSPAPHRHSRPLLPFTPPAPVHAPPHILPPVQAQHTISTLAAVRMPCI